MVSLHLPLYATLIALLAAASHADLTISNGNKRVALVSDGDGDVTFNIFSDQPGAGLSVSDSDLYTLGTITTQVSGSGTNFTVALTLDNGVGSDDIVFSLGPDSVTGFVVAMGFVIKSGGTIVSGDNAAGVSVGQSGSFSFDVMVVDEDGNSADISGTTIRGRASSGTYMKELDSAASSISSSNFILAIAPNRVGSGNFVIDFEAPALTFDGESFETVLKVTQSTSPAPSCVAMGGSVAVSGGKVSVSMFNLLAPPQSSAISTVTISVGSSTASWNVDASSLSNPDQTVVFDFATNGKATITCDGINAVMQGGDLMITGGGGTSMALAKDIVSDLPTNSDFLQFVAGIRIIDSSVATLPASVASLMVKKVCAIIAGDGECKLTKLVDGSAVCTIEGNIPKDTDPTADLQAAVTSCELQAAMEYGSKCEQVELTSSKVNAVGVGGAVAVGGLATWTIVLIAGVGAFALIALIMLGLMAVYRRSAEQSESDYSSSGPLGVPDPSDLLYEQSIVRDIYGRGDFPEGGPTAEVAQQREREADLREEFPRPPSSSGLSRATDDASSTYSV